jgi:hypothetical protein
MRHRNSHLLCAGDVIELGSASIADQTHAQNAPRVNSTFPIASPNPFKLARSKEVPRDLGNVERQEHRHEQGWQNQLGGWVWW